MSKIRQVIRTLRAWSEDPQWCWFEHCNVCGKRKWFSRLYEVYYEKHWWCYACRDCMVKILGERLEKYLKKE